jgi:hypothetical protein
MLEDINLNGKKDKAALQPADGDISEIGARVPSCKRLMESRLETDWPANWLAFDAASTIAAVVQSK